MKDESLSKSFTYYYKIPMREDQVELYQDGWEFSNKTILSEMSRQGLIVENNESIQVLFNTRFDICATYPEYLIVPKALTGE